MNVHQYLTGIQTDYQRFGSIDDAQVLKLEAGQAIHLVTELDRLIVAKTYLIESIERGINGTMVLKDSDHMKITVHLRDFNVFQAVTGYGKTLSRMFLDMKAAKLYIENVMDIMEIKQLDRELGNIQLAKKTQGKTS